jgi:hypothetical protein
VSDYRHFSLLTSHVLTTPFSKSLSVLMCN